MEADYFFSWKYFLDMSPSIAFILVVFAGARVLDSVFFLDIINTWDDILWHNLFH